MAGLLLYGESSHFSRKPDSRTKIMFISPNRFAVKNISFEDYVRGEIAISRRKHQKLFAVELECHFSFLTG